MDVVLSIGGQVIVDDQGHLLDINASGLRGNKRGGVLAIMWKWEESGVACHLVVGVD